MTAAPVHDLHAPRDLTDALRLIGQGARPLAGGTDLMVLLAAGRLPPGPLVDLTGLDALRGVQVADDAVVLGTLTSYTEVQAHPVLSTEFPMLSQAASETGGWAIQNRGTLGGNIANASPAADSPPALLCYDAQVELVSLGGSRWVPYDGFHTGYKQTVMRQGELIRAIRLPRLPEGERGQAVHHYHKVGPRKAQAISKVCLAALLVPGARARVALGGVAPTVVRCHAVEALILARAPFSELAAALSAAISPIDDVRSTAAYRRRVAQNLLSAFARPFCP